MFDKLSEEEWAFLLAMSFCTENYKPINNERSLIFRMVERGLLRWRGPETILVTPLGWELLSQHRVCA